jgi:hypothetical protein
MPNREESTKDYKILAKKSSEMREMVSSKLK